MQVKADSYGYIIVHDNNASLTNANALLFPTMFLKVFFIRDIEERDRLINSKSESLPLLLQRCNQW